MQNECVKEIQGNECAKERCIGIMTLALVSSFCTDMSRGYLRLVP